MSDNTNLKVERYAQTVQTDVPGAIIMEIARLVIHASQANILLTIPMQMYALPYLRLILPPVE